MSYEDLVSYLLLYLEVDDSKTVFFNLAVNIHGMSGVDIFKRLKELKTAVEVANAFIALLYSLLKKEENFVYVNDEEVSVAKTNVSIPAKKTLLMETPETKKPPARCVQARCAAKNSLMFKWHLNQQPLMLSSRRRNLIAITLKSSNCRTMGKRQLIQ
jgi:hypothetical protein